MIGERIKLLRIQQGLSLNELSHLANVSKSYISYIERGIQKDPSPHIISRIAKVLNTNIEELFADAINDSYFLDKEWIDLLQDGVHSGLNKTDFKLYIDFIKYRKKHSSY
ncbi:helix-turn-helix domain-containing protein [Caldibacillus lycopersici]|uniref:Helix-turn-helix domain-containing protein n=1 Tax=Perspicuibacillus lycopersici TaxID=1325689 RepID=A0AAE3IUM7_9BACI|nr:helix-turn-helix domain-containing protein [Perspicuibacillus lycopersici]MCU9614507.1 helix-turn-helix domain-containing protein [Perspicuibacillus lycopersici]